MWARRPPLPPVGDRRRPGSAAAVSAGEGLPGELKTYICFHAPSGSMQDNTFAKRGVDFNNKMTAYS